MTTQEAIKSILPNEYLDIFLEEELHNFVEKISQKLSPQFTPEMIIDKKWTYDLVSAIVTNQTYAPGYLVYKRPQYLLETQAVSTNSALKYFCQTIRANYPTYITQLTNENILLINKFNESAYNLRGTGSIHWVNPGYLLGNPMHLTNTIRQEWTHSVETQGDTPIHFLEVVSYHFSGYTYRKTTYLFKLTEIYGATTRVLTPSPNSVGDISLVSEFYTLLNSSLYIYPVKDHNNPLYSDLLPKIVDTNNIDKRKNATISSILEDFVERYYFQVSDSKAFIICYNCNVRTLSMAIEAELISLTLNIISDARV